VVGDEINRASPKTQSALLEAMEERQVSVDGTTYVLETPFMVIATQNPIEMEGTYPLPEAQRDRFTARVTVGYPSASAELEMLGSHGASDPIDDLEPVADAFAIRKLIEVVRTVHVSTEVKQYVVDLLTATRTSKDLRLGASPRSGLQLVRAARATAALDGRDYVRKPLLSREGANVAIRRVFEPGFETGGDYGEEGFVFQEYAPLPDFGGVRPVIGSWVIGQEAAGIGIRESDGPVTDNTSRFVPHAIV